MEKEFFYNEAKRRLKKKEKLSAAWIHSGSPVTATIVANAGFDVAVIDLEHSPFDTSQLVPLIQAMNGTGCTPIVRAPWNDMVAIKKILDCGAYGIHVPFVCTLEEAEYAVRACKYPPKGVRGASGGTNAALYGYHRADYFEKANEEGIVMLAIETKEGAANVERYLELEDVDGIFIGPSDLGASMGYLNRKSEEVEAVIREIEEKVVHSAKFLATIAKDAAAAKLLYERGYNLVIFFDDLVDLAVLARKTVEEFQTSIN